MADRISNLATSNQLMSYLSITQNRLIDLQYQLTSEKVSSDYQGIQKNAQYLLGLESSRTNIAGYMKNNEIMNVRLDITNTSMDGISKTVDEFTKNLKIFDNLAGKTELNIDTIQQQAFNSLLSMQAYLNTSVGGRYIYAGGRVDTVPVDMNLTTLADFQAVYDGAAVTYPTTRDANIEDFTLNRDSADQTNWLTFKQDDDGDATTAGTGSITATTAQFANVAVGSTFEVTGTTNNNGTYTVSAVTNGGKTIQVNTRMLTTEANNAAAVITKSDGTVLKAANFTDLSFDRASNRITVGAASAGTNALSALTVGSTFTVSGTAQNNGTYTVAAVAGNGDTVDIVPKKISDEGTPPTFSYSGDQAFTVNAGDDTISAVAGTYTSLTVGESIVIAGTASNNGTYTITSIAADGSSVNVSEALTGEATASFTGNQTFTVNAGDDTISAAIGTYSALAVGETVVISGTASNDGTYTVTAIAGDGSSINVSQALTGEGPVASTAVMNIGVPSTAVSSTGATLTHNFSGNQAFTNNVAPTKDTITAAAGSYTGITAGMSVVIAGSVSNNGTYTVSAVSTDGSTLTVNEALTTEAAVPSSAVVNGAVGTVSSKNYYSGDSLTQEHRVDETRSFNVDLNGLDPAFEKAIRAMALIAQGAYGTEGGLDQNLTRATNATYLLGSAKDGTVAGAAPYGTEQTSNMKDIQVTTSYYQILIKQTTESHTSYTGFLEKQIANIENADPLETIVQLLDDQRALEASYQTLARIRELSLVNYM